MPIYPLLSFIAINLIVPCSFGARRITRAKNANTSLGKSTNTLHSSIFADAKILVGIIGRDPICEHSHGRGEFLVRAESKQRRGISWTLEVPRLRLASFHYLHKKRAAHSIASTKEVRRVCGYLGELISHEHVVAQLMVARDAKVAERGASLPLPHAIVLLLEGENGHHHVLSVVPEKCLHI
jgi:hypothetical protein